jgi:hypothetical protein
MADTRDWALLLQDVIAAEVSSSGSAEGASDIVDAFAQARDRLLGHLEMLLGKAGTAALWQRSITLTRRRHPGLMALLGGTTDVKARVLHAQVQADPAALREASVALLTTLVNLLVTFIGEPLTIQVLCEVWPDAAPRLREEKESP